MKALLVHGILSLSFVAGLGGPVLLAGPDEDAPRIALGFHKEPDKLVPFPSMRFGISLLGVKDPFKAKELKKLIYDPLGRSCNVCVKIDGAERLLGSAPGQWLEKEGKLGADDAGRERNGLRSTWLYPDEKILITQSVEVARGQQTFDVGTCWIRYTIENKDGRPHRAGLRFLLDTVIGSNDAAPFIVPGETVLCETSREYLGSGRVPEFVQALESFDLKNPGVVAHLNLKPGAGLEPPSRVNLGSWPDPLLKAPGAQGASTLWNVPVISIEKSKDAAAVLYWDEKELPAGGKRQLGFTYGLGNFSGNDLGDLGIILAGTFQAGADLTVLALVKPAQESQTLTLRLSEGLQRLDGAETQNIPPPGQVSKVSPVTWKVRAPREGVFAVGIESSNGSLHSQGVKIHK